MSFLESEQVDEHRRELVELGYTVIKGVWDSDFITEMNRWSSKVVEDNPPDEKFRYQGSDIHVFTEDRWARRVHLVEGPTRMPHANAQRIIEHPLQEQICNELGFGAMDVQEWVILLSKPPGGLQCYWHQDYINWNSPECLTPWPTVLSFGYYLCDTHRGNGCLRVIPGSHRKRHELHDQIPTPHDNEVQQMTDLSDATFSEHPDCVDIEANAGDLVLVDARLLHSTWSNESDERRTLLLHWRKMFQNGTIPQWWQGELPAALAEHDPSAKYPETKIPGPLLIR